MKAINRLGLGVRIKAEGYASRCVLDLSLLFRWVREENPLFQ